MDQRAPDRDTRHQNVGKRKAHRKYSSKRKSRGWKHEKDLEAEENKGPSNPGTWA